MADTTITLIGVREADTGLHKFAAGVEDWRPFWRLLSERLADTAQSRWPLRRRTGTLRRSLTWAGNRLGWAGVYESAPDRLRFGSDLILCEIPAARDPKAEGYATDSYRSKTAQRAAGNLAKRPSVGGWFRGHMTLREAAIKRITDAGGRWPPKMAGMTLKPWPGTGRYEPLPCRGCGQKCDPSRSWCPACSAVLP